MKYFCFSGLKLIILSIYFSLNINPRRVKEGSGLSEQY